MALLSHPPFLRSRAHQSLVVDLPVMEGLSLPPHTNCSVEIEPVLPTEPDIFRPNLPAALSIVADGVVANHLAVTATLVTLKSTVHVISTLVQKDPLSLETAGDSGIEVIVSDLV